MNKQANRGPMSPLQGQAASIHSLSSICSLVSVSFLCLLLLFSYPFSMHYSVRFREVSHNTPLSNCATKKKTDIRGASVLRHRIVIGPSFVYVCSFLKTLKLQARYQKNDMRVSPLSPMPLFQLLSSECRGSLLQVSFCSEWNTRTWKRKEHLMEFVALLA